MSAAGDLASRLRRCRTASGLTQRGLAERLGTTRHQISLIERGLCVPDPAAVTAWTWATGCGDQDAELAELACHALPPVHIEPDPPLAVTPVPGPVKPRRRSPAGLPAVIVDELA